MDRDTQTGASEASGQRQAAGVVLCGGRSRRMGRDKALLRLDAPALEGEGVTLLERTARLLEELCDPVSLACGPAPRYAELGRPLTLDAIEDGGPLAGLVAALEGCEREWLVAVACDLPRLEPALLRALLDHAIRADADACLYATDSGPEPLLAVYRRTCAGPARAALDAGRRRMVAFHDGLRIASLGERELPPELRGRDLAHNLNTPEELSALAVGGAR